ncbi:GP158 protein, partial [Certhia brachydactyla]|nr:GP158 protein [Certhia brachydactyla]
CRPCRPGCATCEDDTPCLIQEDQVLRAAVLSCQACCMLAIFLSMLVSYHFRRSKARIRTSGIILLETILFGSLLLYFPVFILYFKPSIFRCIVLRWVRMLGFAIVYGTITLKLYRTPKTGGVWCSGPPQWEEFGAQDPWWGGLGGLRRPWGLGTPVVGRAGGSGAPHCDGQGAHWDALGSHWDVLGSHWDVLGSHWAVLGCSGPVPLCPTAEMLFLLWGSFLCYATRAVPSAFHEPRYMGIALHNELMVSAAFHLVRIWVPGQGGRLWGLEVGRGEQGQELSWGVTAPVPAQFLHTGSPLREEITAEVYEDELDMRRSGSCMNSSIASAWSERSLDPDDIREELKKLYRQLEMHKTWRMATNNPHLAKKRSSRRSLARSILRR